MIAKLHSHDPELDGADVHIWQAALSKEDKRFSTSIRLGREWDSKALEWQRTGTGRMLSVLLPGKTQFSQASFPALLSVQAWDQSRTAFLRAAGVKKIRHGEHYYFRIPEPDEYGRFVPELVSEAEFRQEFPREVAA